MFTGIIEAQGVVTDILQDEKNIHFSISSPISSSLKIDQSVAHDGVCLTVVGLDEDRHTVTAVAETLSRTNLKDWKVGSHINLERAMLSNARLDGHIVQGHVDITATVVDVREDGGSWIFKFEYPKECKHLLVDKGSICINGVSLTVVNPSKNQFGVAIIPYTYEHTGFKYLKTSNTVNLEFDIIGKYISKYAAVYASNLKS